jgi:hypothetical protein
MSKKIFILVFVASLFLFSCTVQKGPNMKEGMWEVTMRMEVSGMQMPPQTYTQCLSPKEAVPQPRQKESAQECKTVKQDVTGDTVTWKVECKTKEGIAVSDGTITYKGDTMQGTITMAQGSMKATQHLSGRWIGPCKK